MAENLSFDFLKFRGGRGLWGPSEGEEVRGAEAAIEPLRALWPLPGPGMKCIWHLRDIPRPLPSEGGGWGLEIAQLARGWEVGRTPRENSWST